ncbi:MAG: peptide chain release factor N(5)-glutamine methyltransferase [Balneola sp.]
MSNTRNEWTVLSMLEWATSYFEEKEVKSPRLSIEWLLAFVLNIKRLDLYLKYDRPLTSEELEILRPFVKRRANHEPLQYITGETEFYNSTIKINPSVLIPRQETEQLVQLISTQHQEEENLTVLDIGTGSGCIPIALKKEFDSWDVSGFDISTDALRISNENADINNVHVHFFEHNLFESNLNGDKSEFDLIISNPPYILSHEEKTLDDEVKNFEPHLALFCESTQKMYGAIETFCSKNLSKNGTLYLELHESYSSEVKDLFTSRNWNAEIAKDLDEKDRFLVASKG